MSKHIKKSDLPQKVCAGCGRPFAWRKKWEKVWEEVRYCSDACRGRGRHRHKKQANFVPSSLPTCTDT